VSFCVKIVIISFYEKVFKGWDFSIKKLCLKSVISFYEKVFEGRDFPTKKLCLKSVSKTIKFVTKTRK